MTLLHICSYFLDTGFSANAYIHKISVFVDESGDFGEYEKHSPYYIVTMVFHDQSKDIGQDIIKLDRELKNLGYNNPVIYTYWAINQERRGLYEFVAKWTTCGELLADNETIGTFDAEKHFEEIREMEKSGGKFVSLAKEFAAYQANDMRRLGWLPQNPYAPVYKKLIKTLSMAFVVILLVAIRRGII